MTSRHFAAERFILIAEPHRAICVYAFGSVEESREVIHYVAGHPVNRWWSLSAEIITGEPPCLAQQH